MTIDTDKLKDLLTIEAMGFNAMTSPYILYDSASRIEMVSSHTGQAIVPRESDIPRSMHGFEKQLSDFVFNIRAPDNGTVWSTHQKHQVGFGMDSIRSSPTTTIIYQREGTSIYDCFDIDRYMNNHNTFGYPLVLTPKAHYLRKGVPLIRHEVLAQSPNVHEGGIWSTGIDTNVVQLSEPASEQDGYVVSDEWCERAAPLEMESITIEFGSNYYPLNLYGTPDNPKPFPDIGDTIRPDGLVAVLRQYNESTDALEMSAKGLSEIDMMHDRRYYISGTAGAVVHDIVVDSSLNDKKKKSQTPEGLNNQAERYLRSLDMYYEGIRQSYEKMRKESGYHEPLLSPALQALITRAYAQKPQTYRSNNYSGLVNLTYKGAKIDEYRVQIFYNVRKVLTRGAKISDYHGTKGVICEIRPKALMPRDKDGNIADVIGYHKSVISRQNGGQLIEMFVNAASRDLSKRIRAMVANGDPRDEIIALLTRYYEITSCRTHDIVKNWNADRWDEHIAAVCKDGIYIVNLAVDKTNTLDIVRNIRKEFHPLYAPILLTSFSGRIEETVNPVLIGSKHMIVLEKTNHRPMAAASCILQHHGLPAGSNRDMSNAHPGKRQAGRIDGETEVRHYANTIGGDTIAEIMELVNDPDITRAAIRTIITSPEPMQIPNLITDREATPRGRSRALQFIKTMLLFTGIEIIDVEQELDD